MDHQRGHVLIMESSDSYEIAWYRDETDQPPRATPIAEIVLHDPRAALEWARSRAEVVIVERGVDGGAYGSFSAGRSTPPWSPELARLDERAMLDRAPAPWPTEGEFGWTRLESYIETTHGEHRRRPVDYSQIPETASSGTTGTASERLARILGELPTAPTETMLRALLAPQAIAVGDDHLDGTAGGDYALLPLFDHANRRELICYLLVYVSDDGRLHELHVVTITQTLEF